MQTLAWLTEHPIAHRGYHDLNRTVWENTLAAFERAVEAGFAIECDLHLAADGVPVVFHDDMLERLCSLPGRTRDKLSTELALLTVGGTRERIPTFKQLLALVAGRVPIVVELKGCEGDDDDFAGAVLEDLDGYEGPVALMSFDHWLLRDLRALECPYPLGLTAEGQRNEDLQRHEDAMRLGLDFVSYCAFHLPNRFIDGVRESGKPVITWTVRDEAALAHSMRHADQITFEGFDPRTVSPSPI